VSGDYVWDAWLDKRIVTMYTRPDGVTFITLEDGRTIAFDTILLHGLRTDIAERLKGLTI
jgi:hypothetical protein